jgi:hypothetical protein
MDEKKDDKLFVELAKDIIKKAKKGSSTMESEPPPTPEPKREKS